MPNGQFNLGKQSGGVLSISFPDGVSNTEVVLPESGTLATKEATVDIYNSHIPMSNFASYHLIDGSLSVENIVLTNGFGLYLYTGNTITPPTINLGMDLESQWGDNANETYGYLIKIKSRSAVGDWIWVNSVRGSTKYISSNTTGVEGTDANMFTLSTVGGVTTLNIGTSTRVNTNGVTYVVEVYQTTHRKTGVTNQGKTFTEHYNPFTGFTINGYGGSGLAGHEIPHSLGRKLGFVTVRNLTDAVNWVSTYDGIGTDKYLNINTTVAVSSYTGINIEHTQNSSVLGSFNDINGSGKSIIMYGWANSYFDESGRLIGNFEIGVYQGAGVAGNKVVTRGKLASVDIKRLDAAESWLDFNIIRGITSGTEPVLIINTAAAEYTPVNYLTVNSNGFSLIDTTSGVNISGGQYLYFGVYDNDNGSGKSKYYKATNNANVQVNNARIPLAKGIDSNGVKNEIVVANETITGVTWEEGKNYPYRTSTGYGKSMHKPRYLKSELVRTYAGEQPDYFDVEKNKWFSCDDGSELVSNGGFDVNIDGVTSGTDITTSWDNGMLKLTTTGANTDSGAYINVPTTIGKKYTFEFIYANSADYLNWKIDNGALTSIINSGKYSYTFIAQNTTTKIEFFRKTPNGGQVHRIDNLTVFPTEITPTTEIPESRNYMNHIVHADSQGNPLFVEELPKVKYENYLKIDKLSVINEFDLGQTTNIYTGSKFLNVPYLNETGKPKNILFSVLSTGNTGISVSIDGKTYGLGAINIGGIYGSYFFIVPPNSVYKILSGSFTIHTWNEYE